jgi:hypothetical protein
MGRPSLLLPLLGAGAFAALSSSSGGVPQIPVPLIEDSFPPVPSPFVLPDVDFTALARNQTALIFSLDPSLASNYTPLLWWDGVSQPPTFGTPSYVGPPQGGPTSHELIASGALVMSAFLTGANMSCYDVPGPNGTVANPCVDLESMLLAYYSTTYGVWRDNTGASDPTSEFWYQTWMSMLPLLVSWSGRGVRAGALGPLAPSVLNATSTWASVLAQLGGSPTSLPDFNFTGVNFTTGVPGKVEGFQNGRFTQPVASAGLAWLFFASARAFPDDPRSNTTFLQAADWSLRYLEAIPYDPYWEILLPWGALAAARMNAELGRGGGGGGGGGGYDLHRLITWILQDDMTPPCSPFRWGWGVTAEAWAGVDVYGLVASVTDRDGYAFNMDTAVALAGLLPVSRYNASYAHSLARWAVNAFNAARLFYPAYVPPSNQSDWGWASSLKNGAPSPISYEGLRRWGFNETNGPGGGPANNITGPFATGDAKWAWGAATNLAIYGSAYTGLYSALLVLTNASTVPSFDLLATDPFHAPAYPSRLLVNPDEGNTVGVEVPMGPDAAPFFDIYDAVAQSFVARNQTSGAAAVTLQPGSAAVLVAVPAGAAVSYDAQHGWLLADGVVIDWASSGLPPGEAREGG